MEEMLKDWIETIRAYNPGGTILSKAARRSRLTVVRFADDFVVLHPELEVIREAQTKISTWLSAMGLELHPDKTSIRHTFLAQPEQDPGFKFLGFWIRNYPVRTSEEAKRKSGYRTYIRPHPDNISRVLRQIKKVLFTIRDVKTVVRILNPIITGWSNYYRSVASKSTFTSMDKELVFKLIKWAKRKHPKRNTLWIMNQYFQRMGARQRFGHRENSVFTGLKTFAETPIERHNKVTGSASPFDGNFVYWVLRGRETRKVSPYTWSNDKRDSAPGVNSTLRLPRS